MRRTLVALLALLLAPLPAAAGDLILRDVIELHRTGLGDDLLVAMIDADGSVFTLSFADIQDLKSDGLSERVIAALVRTGSRRAAAAQSAAPPVHVSQNVVTYAPTVVVVQTPAASQGQVERAEPKARAKRVNPPATWITPRDPTPREPAAPAKRSPPPR